jgi:hypothetical protein
MGSYASLFLKAPAPASSAKIHVPGVLQDALPPPPAPPLQEQEDNAPHPAASLELHPTAPRSPKEEEYLAAGKVSYTQWRNERRKQGRRNVNMMLAHLDEILPKTFQSSPSPNGAGGRAVGAQGRSLHDVALNLEEYTRLGLSDAASRTDSKRDAHLAKLNEGVRALLLKYQPADAGTTRGEPLEALEDVTQTRGLVGSYEQTVD